MEELNNMNVENQVADTTNTNKDLKGRIIAAAIGLAVGIGSTIATTKIGKKIAEKRAKKAAAEADTDRNSHPCE